MTHAIHIQRVSLAGAAEYRRMKKIALEEHFWTEGFPHTGKVAADLFEPWFLRHIDERLGEFSELRIAAMDAAGIDVSVLSLVSPGVQIERDPAKAVSAAARANDVLAGEIAKHPTRYAGFAHLPMQEPGGAARELERCVGTLGFKGALINGHSNGIYLDEARYIPFWERVAALDVPVYIHPVHMAARAPVLDDYPGLAASLWGWTTETGGHALRLILSGLFDRLPMLNIILGHMGELLPFCLWRLDSRFKIYRPKVKLERLPSDYVRRHIFATTAGACQPEALVGAIAAIGADRVMFSVDYPLEDSAEAARFIAAAPISEHERELICWRNAAKLLRL
jgi:2,3-dihydroxybenzoate decarboxylase